MRQRFNKCSFVSHETKESLKGKLNALIKLSKIGRIDMLRTLFIIGLICGFCYTAIEVKVNFTELRANRIAQIEAVLAQ